MLAVAVAVAAILVGISLVPSAETAAPSVRAVVHPAVPRDIDPMRHHPHRPHLHCAAAAVACVDTRHHRAWLQTRGRVTYGPVRVALGGAGYRTPAGRFHVEWKAEDWTSTEFGIPMPWSVFFATGGIAFHAGPLDEQSHGCVHLRPRAAHAFFKRLEVGDVVVVR